MGTQPSPALTISINEAADLLGISRNTGYRLVKAGEFPVPVLRIGAQMKVSRRAIEEFVACVTQPDAS